MALYMSEFADLYMLAREDLLRRQAEMMLDYVLLEYALSFLDGIYSGAHSRVHDFDLLNLRLSNSVAFAFMYFAYPELRDVCRWRHCLPALSGYEAPPVLVQIASLPSEPYELRERRGNPLRPGVKVDVQRYTYIAPEYAIGSVQGPAWPDEEHCWSVKMNSHRPTSIIFFHHPSAVRKRSRWNGASPYERVLHHANALIATYNIPPEDPHPWVHGYLPRELDEIDPPPESMMGQEQFPRWIFVREADCLVALHPLQPFTVTPATTPAVREPYPPFEYWEIRSDYCKNGVVIEAGSLLEWGSLERFQRAVSANYLRVDLAKVHVSYRTTSGVSLELSNPGRLAPLPTGGEGIASEGDARAVALANGQPANWGPYALFDCPFVQSEYDSGLIRAEKGGHGLVLDFNTWKRQVW